MSAYRIHATDTAPRPSRLNLLLSINEHASRVGYLDRMAGLPLKAASTVPNPTSAAYLAGAWRAQGLLEDAREVEAADYLLMLAHARLAAIGRARSERSDVDIAAAMSAW